MKVHLQYGRDGLDVESGRQVRVIEPAFVPGLADEAAAFPEAVRDPIGGKPLRESVAAHERVAIVIPDITRPLPTDRLLPWVFAELGARAGRERRHRQRHRLAPRRTRRTSCARWWARTCSPATGS